MARIVSSLHSFHLPERFSSFSVAQLQLDACQSSFSEQALDVSNLFAMTCGGLSFRLARASLLSAFQKIPQIVRSPLASAFSLGLEVSVFRGVHLAFSHAPESNASSQSWWGDYLNFACLKGVGHYLRSANPILQHTSQNFGMILGEEVGARLHFTPETQGSLVERFVRASATNLALGVGTALSGKITGGMFHALERNLFAIEPQRSSFRETPCLQESRPFSMAAERKISTSIYFQMIRRLEATAVAVGEGRSQLLAFIRDSSEHQRETCIEALLRRLHAPAFGEDSSLRLEALQILGDLLLGTETFSQIPMILDEVMGQLQDPSPEIRESARSLVLQGLRNETLLRLVTQYWESLSPADQRENLAISDLLLDRKILASPETLLEELDRNPMAFTEAQQIRMIDSHKQRSIYNEWRPRSWENMLKRICQNPAIRLPVKNHLLKVFFERMRRGAFFSSLVEFLPHMSEERFHFWLNLFLESKPTLVGLEDFFAQEAYNPFDFPQMNEAERSRLIAFVERFPWKRRFTGHLALLSSRSCSPEIKAKVWQLISFGEAAATTPRSYLIRVVRRFLYSPYSLEKYKQSFHDYHLRLMPGSEGSERNARGLLFCDCLLLPYEENARPDFFWPIWGFLSRDGKKEFLQKYRSDWITVKTFPTMALGRLYDLSEKPRPLSIADQNEEELALLLFQQWGLTYFFNKQAGVGVSFFGEFYQRDIYQRERPPFALTQAWKAYLSEYNSFLPAIFLENFLFDHIAARSEAERREIIRVLLSHINRRSKFGNEYFLSPYQKILGKLLEDSRTLFTAPYPEEVTKFWEELKRRGLLPEESAPV